MHRAYIAQIMNATEYRMVHYVGFSLYRHAKLDISTSFIE